MSWLRKATLRLAAVSMTGALVLWLGCNRGGEPSEGDHPNAHEENQLSGAHRQAGDLVELSDEALRHVTLVEAKVSRRRVADDLRLPAEVRPHPDRIAHITPLVASQVAEVGAKPGDRVRKGQVLALLKSVQLGEARAEIAQAEAALDVAKDRLKRQEQLMDAEIGAQKSFVEAQGAVKQAQAALSAALARAQVYGGSGGSGSTTVVRSPLDGTVVERHATAGEVASPDQQLFVIANIDPVWVVGRAYESDLGSVRAGMSSVVSVKAYPARAWEGTIAYVAPTLDERTRTAEVRVELPNADGVLKPGMFATLVPVEPDPQPGAGPAPLAVPSSAIQRDGARFLAFVPRGENRYEPRVVSIGRRAAGYVEVLEGLREGESVVVDGTFILKSEAAKHEIGGGHNH